MVLCRAYLPCRQPLVAHCVPPPQALPQPSSLRALEEVLTNLLGQYCSRDLLEVEKVTWQSPSDLIEKVGGARRCGP